MTPYIQDLTDEDSEPFLKRWWRPAMAIQYMIICMFDFLAAPLVTMFFYGPKDYHAWVPLTLQGGAMYHLSMGAIVGVTAWTRSTEKQQAIGMMSNMSSVTSTATQTTVTPVETAAPVKSKHDDAPTPRFAE